MKAILSAVGEILTLIAAGLFGLTATILTVLIILAELGVRL